MKAPCKLLVSFKPEEGSKGAPPAEAATRSDEVEDWRIGARGRPSSRERCAPVRENGECARQ